MLDLDSHTSDPWPLATCRSDGAAYMLQDSKLASMLISLLTDDIHPFSTALFHTPSV